MITALLAGAALWPSPVEASVAAPFTHQVLVFSRTTGFRHDSIPDGIAMLQQIGRERGWTVDVTEDSEWFTKDRLARYETVVFLCTTGDVLNDAQQTDFEAFVRGGGGYVGIHSASDTEYGWAWYGQLVGAYFASHPAVQRATVRIEEAKHPTVRHLPNPWQRVDEWYDFRTNPRGQVSVLASLDPASYQGGRMPDDHPVIWAHERFGGRAWYTAMGHTRGSYREPHYMRMLAEAVNWTMRRPAGKSATPRGGGAPTLRFPPTVPDRSSAPAPLQCLLCF